MINKLFKAQNHQKAIVVFFLIGLILRSLFAICKWNEQGGVAAFVDAWDYIEYAEFIIHKGLFSTDIKEITAYSPPGYPIVLAILFKIFGVNYIIPIALNVLLSSLIIPLIYVVGKTYFNHNIAILSSAWSVFYVKFYEHMADVSKESLLYVYLLVSLILFAKLLKNLSLKNITLFVIFLAVWVHTDERYLALLPVFLIFVFIYQKFNSQNILIVLSGILIFGILQLPWLIRNTMAYQRPVYLTERVALFTDGYLGSLDRNSLYQRNKGYLHGYESFYDSLKLGLNPIVNSTAKKRIIEGVKEGEVPFTFSNRRRYWESFKYFWRPFKFSHSFVESGWKYKGPWSFRNNFITLMVYGILLPFYLLSLLYAFRNQNKNVIFLWAIVLVYTAFHVITKTGIPRYRIPIDSLVILLSFYSVTNLRYFVFENGFGKK